MLRRSLAIARQPAAYLKQSSPSRHFTSASNTANNTAAQQYDITIIGAGIAGSTLACALGKIILLFLFNCPLNYFHYRFSVLLHLGSFNVFKNLKVAIIDPSSLHKIAEWQPPTHSFSNRTVQVTNATQNFLKETGAWDATFTQRAQPYSKVVVSDFLGAGSLSFDDIVGTGSESAAFLIENFNLHSGLAKVLIQNKNNNANVDIIQDKVASISSSEPPLPSSGSTNLYPQIELSNNRTIQTKLLVGTDGANSVVRKHANISSSALPYNQFGLVADLIFDQLNDTAFQRFLPTGPIAILPLPNGFANLVWSMDASRVNKIKNLQDDAFIKLVNMAFRFQNYADFEYILNSINNDGSFPAALNLDQEFEWRIGAQKESNESSILVSRLGDSIQLPPQVMGVSEGTRQGFPLKMSNSQRYYANRIALVGDAAHTMHPLAGMGYNTGVADSIELCKLLKAAVLSGYDIGSTTHVLKPYNSNRYTQNALFQTAVDQLWHLFRSQNPLITGTRGLAMNLLDKLPTIKRGIVKATMY